MKCVGIWYLEACRQIISRGPLKRTIHLTFVPDEEISGRDGMSMFVKSKEFDALNAEFALDEGLSNEEDAFKMYYGERSPWWITLKSKGGTGHGSRFIEPSATSKLIRVLNKLENFRESEKNRLNSYLGLSLGAVTTVNITVLKAGVQTNVVPEEAMAKVDIRIAPGI